MLRFREFINSQHDLSDSSIDKYRFALLKFEELGLTNFEDVYLDKVRVHEILNKISTVLADSTWNLCLGKYKRLAKWLSDPDDEVTPKVWRKIKPKKIDWETKLKDKWLSKEQFYKLLDVCDYVRDKALFGVCIEGALRKSELLDLRVKDVRTASYGYDVMVSGKTGSSSFPVVLFAPLLTHWLNMHPKKHDPDSPLWVARKMGGAKTLYGKLSYPTVNEKLKIYAKRAGLSNKLSLHWLRHSKITWSAKDKNVRVSDEMAKKMFRWGRTSRMFGRYTHLHGVDSNSTFLALAGVKTKEETTIKINVLQPKKCLNCQEINSVTMSYCGKCGFVLNEKEATKMVQQKKLEEMFMKLAVKQLDLDAELKKLEKEENKNAEQILFVEQAAKAVKDLSRTVHDDVKEFKEATDKTKKS